MTVSVIRVHRRAALRRDRRPRRGRRAGRGCRRRRQGGDPAPQGAARAGRRAGRHAGRRGHADPGCPTARRPRHPRAGRLLARAGRGRASPARTPSSGSAGERPPTWPASWRDVAARRPVRVGAHHPAGHGGRRGRRQDRHQSPAGKNLVGAFWEPAAVLADLDFLTSLPVDDLRGGLAEMIKHGFIADPRTLELFEADPQALLTPGSAALAEAVSRSMEVKASVVSGDLRERTSVGDAVGRELLNYGHTLAHAIERRERYRMRHGYAVSIGTMFAALLSRNLGHADDAFVERHRAVFGSVGLPLTYDAGRLGRAARHHEPRQEDPRRPCGSCCWTPSADPFIAEAPDEGVLAATYDERGALMYTPATSSWRDDRVADLLAGAETAQLVTAHESGPVATLLPVLHRPGGGLGTLVFHVTRTNDQWRDPGSGRGAGDPVGPGRLHPRRLVRLERRDARRPDLELRHGARLRAAGGPRRPRVGARRRPRPRRPTRVRGRAERGGVGPPAAAHRRAGDADRPHRGQGQAQPEPGTRGHRRRDRGPAGRRGGRAGVRHGRDQPAARRGALPADGRGEGATGAAGAQQRCATPVAFARAGAVR